jgi:hypothetical protein
MRYYSILRPISIGTYPKPKDNEVLKINNFDNRSYCKDIDREAWGFIDYEKPLSSDDVTKYELAPEHCCGTCTWFNGEIGDSRQFCDEREIEVGEDGYCYRYSRKTAE